MNIFAMAGSLRSGSFNRKLIGLAAEEARRLGAQVNLVEFRDLAPPLYDYDWEMANGLPPEAQAFVGHIEEADGIMIATPEYNNSIPGPLKNAIDWVSRVKPYRLLDKPVLLLGASASRGGALKGLAAIKIPLAFQGAAIHPEAFSLRSGSHAFDPAGRFLDPAEAHRLARAVGEFIAAIEARAGEAPARSSEASAKP